MRRTPPPRKPAESTAVSLKTYAAELIAAVWLAIVAVQYISSCYLDLDVDFRFAYLVILGLIFGLGIFRAVRWFVLRRK